MLVVGFVFFLAELKKSRCGCYCVEPNLAFAEHAIKNVGVNKVFHGNFEEFKTDMKFDIIAFNKILEHVKDPISLLIKARNYLDKNGFVYIELPDGESALKNDEIVKREEFYIEHYTIFSHDSLKFLIKESGFRCDESAGIHEPSDKYTLYAFLT